MTSVEYEQRVLARHVAEMSDINRHDTVAVGAGGTLREHGTTPAEDAP